METDSSPSPSFSFRFLKENLLTVVLAAVGILLLAVGLVQLLSQNQAKIEFEKGSTATHEDRAMKEDKISEVAQTIQVDVSGEVKNPGVYSLKKGARLEQAIASAGGFSDEADTDYVSKNINLAQKLTDGGKIYIPKKGETSVSQGSGGRVAGVAAAININTATPEILDSLPGIGKVTAEKIVNGRPYGSIEELVEKKIVSQKVFDSIKDRISVY